MKASKVLLCRRPATLPSGRKVTYWTLRWPNGSGGTCSESLGRTDKLSAADAKSAQRKKMLDLGLGKVRHKRQRIMLGEYLTQDAESIANEVKPSTLTVHGTVSRQILTSIGDIELSKVGWNEVARLKSWLSAEHTIGDRTLAPCSQATVRKSIVTLRAIFARAIVRGLIDDNPFRGRLAKTQPKAKRIYSPVEIDALIGVAPDLWWRCFIKLAFTSGLRLGELLNVTWADIGETHITVTAKRAGSFTAGNKLFPVLAFSCKSHKERRVPLDPEAAKLLQRLKLKSGGSIYPFIPLERLAILAATEDTTQEIVANKIVNNILRRFRLFQGYARARLANERGVNIHEVEWIVGCVHDLRKSFASHAARHISMVELQKIMGHASITTTADFYVDVSDDLGDKLKLAFAG